MTPAAQREIARGFAVNLEAIEVCEMLNPQVDTDGASFCFKAVGLEKELQFVELPGGWALVRTNTQVALVFLPPMAANRLRAALQYHAAIGLGSNQSDIAALGFDPKRYGEAVFRLFDGTMGPRGAGRKLLEQFSGETEPEETPGETGGAQ